MMNSINKTKKMTNSFKRIDQEPTPEEKIMFFFFPYKFNFFKKDTYNP